MDDPNNAQRRQSLKRSFDQISRSPPPPPGRQSQQPAWTSRFAEAVRNSSAHPPPAPGGSSQNPPAPRFPGDGIDTRRPIMSTTPVIDLTGSDSPEQSRSPQPAQQQMRPFPGGLPPRLNREPSVIDLETLDFVSSSDRETPPVDLTGPTPLDLEDLAEADEDDEVIYISQNPRPRTQSSRIPSTRRNHPLQHPLHPHPIHHAHQPFLRRFLPFVRGGGDAFGQYARPPQHNPRPDRRWDRLERGFQRHERAMGSMGADSRSNRSYVGPGELRTSNPQHAAATAISPLSSGFGLFEALSGTIGFSTNIRLPGNLDYESPAFSMSNPPDSRAMRPTYAAPAPVGEGFTRSPDEDDVLVCPNCDHELSTGEGPDKQVWAIRECGHARDRLEPGS